jgi:3-hydroxyacyl-[acyl-carrier-protein] dehydratase
LWFDEAALRHYKAVLSYYKAPMSYYKTALEPKWHAFWPFQTPGCPGPSAWRGERFPAISAAMNDSLARALAHLPHGPEFRFLDCLTALDPGRSGAGEYTLRDDEPFLRGHFPGQPLMPGVLLVEAAAQLAGVVAQSDPAIPPLRNLRLTAIRAAKILGAALPGEKIQLEARISGRMGGLVQAQANARAGERVLLQADVVLSGDA